MATYPTPKQSPAGSAGMFGPPYLKYLKRAKDWGAITLVSTYEDQGRDFNTSADDAPQFWEFEYGGLDDTEAKVLDDFWDAHKLHVGFTFVEPRDVPWTDIEGDTYTDVHFESYEKDHDKVWIQSRRVVLVKYP